MESAHALGSDPTAFPVAVIVRRRHVARKQPWQRDSWRIEGVVVNSQAAVKTAKGLLLRSSIEGDDYLWGGFYIRLHKDEVESYYHNLKSESPRLFVISTLDEQGVLTPFKITASFDEAHAYLEAEVEVEAVPMPPELYSWVERYVLTHYLPERKVKRKRRDWTEDTHE